MKQLHKNAGLPYIERKETGRACDLKHMTGKHDIENSYIKKQICYIWKERKQEGHVTGKHMTQQMTTENT